MRRIVIGTAGHIDHGKTSLVKALTGTDTDSLKEEKRRGITIELGFAQLQLPNGTIAGLVDVPGHERFVKAMAAGASGIDLVLLVIALDEGAMPQTREHLDICRLLGVQRGLVVLTKGDLACELGADWTGLIEADVAELCRGTFLEGAPVLTVSSRSGEGIEALKQALQTLAEDTPERPVDGPTWLPIDRAFSLKGFGTIVTGTLLSGALAVGDELDLLPDGPSRLRVRSIQVHGADRPKGQAGQRTAVNLVGIEARDVPGGSVAVRGGTLTPSRMLDVELDLLEALPRPVRHRARFLLHLGTAQIPATLALTAGDEIAPGTRAFAQLRLGVPAAALPGQRFILRGFSQIPGRGQTVGGGRVLATQPRKRRRDRPGVNEDFAALAGDDPARRIAYLLREAGFRGLTVQELSAGTALSDRTLQRTMEMMSSRGEALLFDRERRAYASPAMVMRITDRILAAIRAHRAHDRLAPGIPREELRQKLGGELDPRLYARLLATMTAKGALIVDGDVVREKGADVAPVEDDEKLAASVAGALADARLCPPYLDDLHRLVGAPQARVASILKLLEKQGRVVRVNQEMYFDALAVAGLRERLVAFLRLHQKITTQEFKELVQASRKFSIPLGEYFDREKLTLRVGEARVLRGGTG